MWLIVTFFDEIQEVENWEKFVRKVLDNYPLVEIVITVSSSTLLSREIATNLRGRSINMEMLPLNFQEYLKFKNFSNQNIGTKENIKLNILKKEFLAFGTFPEVVLEENTILKKQVLKDYLDLIFYKDIVDRNNFKSLNKLKIFRKLLVSNIGVENITLSNWLEAFKSSYFAFELKKLNFSVMESETSKSKNYVVDNGFYSLLFGGIKEDYGKLLENLVFLEFRKKGFVENENIFYFTTKSGYEVDFITFKDGIIKAYQVSYNLENEKTLQRELRSLQDLRKQFGDKISEYNIVVYDDYEENEIDGIKILSFMELYRVVYF